MRSSEHILRTHAAEHATVLKAHFSMGGQDMLLMFYVHSIYVLCPGGYFTQGSFLEIAVSNF